MTFWLWRLCCSTYKSVNTRPLQAKIGLGLLIFHTRTYLRKCKENGQIGSNIYHLLLRCNSTLYQTCQVWPHYTTFFDALETLHSCATCLCLINEKDQIYYSHIMEKARLSPLKTFSVPRLELCVAIIASQIEFGLRSELHLPFELQPSIFWTDNTTVLR